MTPNPEAAIACLSLGVCSALAIPVLLFAGAEHLTPRALRELPLTTAGFLLLLLGGTPMHDDEMYDEEPVDAAEQAMAEDGYTSLARYFAARPFPQQADRRAA